MPLSWLLLEQWQWGLVPQVQPMRALLFLTLGMQFLTAAAGRPRDRRAPPRRGVRMVRAAPTCCRCNPCSRDPSSGAASRSRWRWPPLTALAGVRWPPVVAVAAFFVIPMLGGVVNYPRLHTAGARAAFRLGARQHSARRGFCLPGRQPRLAPGIFRSEALRAVYVDWKGGGQVNYLKDLGEQWWFRWQQTRNFQPADLPQYAATGVTYVVLQEPLPRAPQFQNATYVVYQIR